MYSTVRDRMKVWPYCTECGCRLNIYLDKYFDGGDGSTSLYHFYAYLHVDKDARGHKCKNLNEVIELKSLDDIFIGE